MRKLSIVLSICLLLGSHAFGQKCSHDAWVQDNDPNGTNVRAAPSLTAKVIQVFPSVEATGEDIDLTLVGYKNGWFEILLGGSGREKGWISARKVAISVENQTGKPATLYSSPSKSSRKAGKIPNDAADFELIGFDCFGLKIKYRRIVGWLSKDDMCGNPRTTCP